MNVLSLLFAGPWLVALIFAGALLLVWRRRPEAGHARTWGCAFILLSSSWGAAFLTDALEGGCSPASAVPSLCWLGATLLLVHGLRQRARRRARHHLLGLIWATTALIVALLFDLGRIGTDVAAAAVPLLTAGGFVLAALVIGRSDGRGKALDRATMAFLACLIAGQLANGFGLLSVGGDPVLTMAVIAVLVIPLYVTLGVGAMLLLNEDLAVELQRLARTDPLTGVWNRRGFDEGAPHLVKRESGAPGPRAAVAIADIDAFKAVNDKFGHHAGDAVLVRFARILGDAAERHDLLARLGGEEFALMAVGVDAAMLFERLERVRLSLSLPDGSGEGPLPVTASFGVADLDFGRGLRDALERADAALYRAKREGRNRTVLADMP